MSANGETLPAPSRSDVEQKLLDLIAGRCDREEAARWATSFVEADVEVEEHAVWQALVELSGADLPSTDRKFLHGEADFCVWLEKLRRSH